MELPRIIKIISPNGGTTYTEGVDFKGAAHTRDIKPAVKGQPSPVSPHQEGQRPFGQIVSITVTGVVTTYTMHRAIYQAGRDWNLQLASNSFTQINLDYSDGTTDETFKGHITGFNLKDLGKVKNASFTLTIKTGTDDT